MKSPSKAKKWIFIGLILVSPILVFGIAEVFDRFFRPGQAMTLAQMEIQARKLAGPNATACGTNSFVVPSTVTARHFNQCEIKSFRQRKAFWSVQDSGDGPSIFTYGKIRRTVVVQTPQGKILSLEARITRQPRAGDLVKVVERERRTPRIRELWPQGPEHLTYDK